MRIIALANQKGGCGKTTTAFHLGSALAAQERKVLLIDGDPQAHLSRLCGFADQPPVETLYAALQAPPRPLHTLIRACRPNLEIVQGHLLLSTLEQELARQPGAVELLANAIHRAWLPHDYVLIDCPPSLGFLTFNALRAAREVIVPIDASYLSLAGVKQLQELIQLVSEQLHHQLSARGLVTLVDLRTTFAQRFLEAVRQQFPGPLYPVAIRQSVTLREASRRQRPSFEFAPGSNGAQDYVALAKAVLEEEPRMAKAWAALEREQHMTRIRLRAPQAQAVYVVGDFTGWQIRQEFQLERGSDGAWQANVNLPPGTYRYKFVIDGQWQSDPENAKTAPNPFGSADSLLDIPGG